MENETILNLSNISNDYDDQENSNAADNFFDADEIPEF